MTAKEALEQAKSIIIAMNNGALTYDVAKAKCEPLLAIANARITEIAKKYNQRPKTINFASFRRS